MSWINELPRNRRRGSYPRCLALMEGDRVEVACRLTALVDIDGVEVPADSVWMPTGIPRQRVDGSWDRTPIREAQLGKAEGFLDAEQRAAVTGWWLRVVANANTPNWDIAATCTIHNTTGLLLVEAKAHESELLIEANGKKLDAGCTDNSFKNHLKIGEAIAGAAAHLQRATGWPWAISRDRCYQMSNRFAWAWKVASLGVPVVLAYLGFLNANEMPSPFRSHEDWEESVYRHACGLVPKNAWNQTIAIGQASLHACIRSTKIDLP